MSSNEKIKERAYSIWEQEGRPEGRHTEHWNQAEKELKLSEKESVIASKKTSDNKNQIKPDLTTKQKDISLSSDKNYSVRKKKG